MAMSLRCCLLILVTIVGTIETIGLIFASEIPDWGQKAAINIKLNVGTEEITFAKDRKFSGSFRFTRNEFRRTVNFKSGTTNPISAAEVNFTKGHGFVRFSKKEDIYVQNPMIGGPQEILVKLKVNILSLLFSGTVPKMINSFVECCHEKEEEEEPHNDDDAKRRDQHLRHRIDRNTQHNVTDADTRNQSKSNDAIVWKAELGHNQEVSSTNTTTRDDNDSTILPSSSECLFMSVALGSNFLLFIGGIFEVTLFYLPWMIVYGTEIIAGFAVGLGLLVLPGLFRAASFLGLLRASLLTYGWVYIVRRHLKEVNEMAKRPRLQTILSIITAHPFSPRPEVDLSLRPQPPEFD